MLGNFWGAFRDEFSKTSGVPIKLKQLKGIPKFIFAHEGHKTTFPKRVSEILPKFIRKPLETIGGAIHRQDVEHVNLMNLRGIKKLKRLLAKHPKSKVYFHTSDVFKKALDDAGDTKEISRIAKKHGATLYNAYSSKFSSKLEDKTFINHLLGKYGPGRTIVLPRNKRALIKFLEKAKKRKNDLFIKQQKGWAGSGVQTTLSSMTDAQRRALIRDVGKRNPYIAQPAREADTTFLGAKKEFRVHVVNGKVVNMESRHGFGYALPWEREKIEKASRAVARRAAKHSKSLGQSVLALDVAIDKKGKPVVYEIQDQSGFATHIGSGALSDIQEHLTGKAPILTRAKRVATTAGVGALGVAGGAALAHKLEVNKKPASATGFSART